MRLYPKGFSMVEVAAALGIAVFTLLSILALLSMGVHSNQISIEETRASHILAALESDLRDSYPVNGKSIFFSLPSPYSAEPSGLVANQAIKGGTMYTVKIDESESPVTEASAARFRVSVIYTVVSAANSLAPVEARLVVNWPPLDNPLPAQITDRSKVNYVETYVAFPIP